jgi:hypothetical protein
MMHISTMLILNESMSAIVRKVARSSGSFGAASPGAIALNKTYEQGDCSAFLTIAQ